MAHPKLWDVLYQNIPVNNNNNLGSPKRVFGLPVVTKLYPSPQRKQVHNKVQRPENSGPKLSFLEIEVHSQKAGWDCVEAI
jgi:hypothetical protein